MSRRPEYRHGIKRGRIVDWPDGVGTREDVAARVTYNGNPEHKTYPTPAGPPAIRSDKAKCDRFAEQDWSRVVVLLRYALRDAILAGCVSDFRGGFPFRAWVWVNDVLHEARLTNEGTGEYHGFPINDERQYPEPFERVKAAPRVQIPIV